MKLKIQSILALLLIVSSGISQTFQFVQPAGTSGLSVNFTTHIIEGDNGEIHCLTRADTIIMTLENNQWTLLGRATNGFTQSGSNANDFEIMPDGKFWVVHFNSIDEWDGNSALNLTASNSDLVNDFVESVVVRDNNEVWIGYGNGFGVSKQSTNGTWTHKGSFTGNFSSINNIFVPQLMDRNRLNDDVWAVYSSNLYKISDSEATTISFTSTPVPSLYSTAFKDMTVTDDGVVWFALESNSNDPDEGGLLSFDGTNWTHYNTNNSGISTNSLAALTHYGNRVVFTSHLESGVSILDNGTFTTYNSSNTNFPVNSPYSYTYDLLKKDNKIYIATNTGILILEMPFPSEIDEIKHTKLVAFPNPANAEITILDVNDIQLIDISGKIVLTSNSGKSIDISNLSKGTYIIKGFDVSNKLVTGSFVKE